MTIVNGSLSRSLVRAEARKLTGALRRYTGEVLRTFHEGVEPRFREQSRLTLTGMQALAMTLNNSAESAFSPLSSNMVLVPPTPGRPQSGSYEILHYWVNPAEVEGTSNRDFRLAVFSAWGDRKTIAMRAHDTLTRFYEHAAHRLLERCGSKEAAIEAIGRRLVETLILPTLALDGTPETLIDTEMHIPFESGLLLGRFLPRVRDRLSGEYTRIDKRGRQSWTITFSVPAEFVVKTYIGPEQMTERQDWIAYEVNVWLAAHRNEAEIIRRHVCHKDGTLWDGGFMSRTDFDALRADFWQMRNRVFG